MKDLVHKFNNLTTQFKNVKPRCEGCGRYKPQKGWITSGPTKYGLTTHRESKKRKSEMLQIDLATFKPRPLEVVHVGIREWLADSRLAWSQLVRKQRMKHRFKKQKTRIFSGFLKISGIRNHC